MSFEGPEKENPALGRNLREFQEHLVKCKKIVALVGAGLSVSSGLPTFRGTEGLWKNFNMIDLATPDAFYIDPGLVWQFYSWRRYESLRARPNAGHDALLRLSNLKQLQYVTITQNVDGLLVRSGHNSENLHEIHGSLFTLKCTSFLCNYVDTGNFKSPLTPALKSTEFEYSGRMSRKRDREHIDKAESDIVLELPQFAPVAELEETDLPQCPVCKDGSLLRPGVVWFGESLPLQELNEIDDFLEQQNKPVDLILVIGTSGTVYPANSYVEKVRLQGGKVAVFNTDIEPSVLAGEQSDTWGFRGDAAVLLPVALAPLLGLDKS